MKEADFVSGNAGNSFYFNTQVGFSTPDNDNDRLENFRKETILLKKYFKMVDKSNI